jgi:hypothetical protein
MQLCTEVAEDSFGQLVVTCLYLLFSRHCLPNPGYFVTLCFFSTTTINTLLFISLIYHDKIDLLRYHITLWLDISIHSFCIWYYTDAFWRTFWPAALWRCCIQTQRTPTPSAYSWYSRYHRFLPKCIALYIPHRSRYPHYTSFSRWFLYTLSPPSNPSTKEP